MEIKLPDGSSRQLPDGANAFDLANDIGKNLAKSAVAASVSYTHLTLPTMDSV